MSLIKLQSGHLEAGTESLTEIPNSLDRKALLVYAGKFNSMDGPVEVTDEHLAKLADEHNNFISRMSAMFKGELPVKFNQPIQLDHSTSAKDTVGRLQGPLEIGEHTLEDGTKVKALYGALKILGKENVEKVMDGRWTHLSVGADFETGKLTELTITPFPAAAEASLLSKKRMSDVKDIEYKSFEVRITYDEITKEYRADFMDQCVFAKSEKDAIRQAEKKIDEWFKKTYDLKGATMFEKLKKFLVGTKKLSEGEAIKEVAMMDDEAKKHMQEEAEKHEKMKKHLVEHEKMSEEDADKKLAEMPEEEKKALMDKCAAEEIAVEKKEEEKLAEQEVVKEEQAAEKMKHLRSKIAEISKLASDMRGVQADVKLAQRKSSIITKLSALKASAKITPAEIKKIDIARLAKTNDVTIEEVLKSYESREPVIMTGLIGSNEATSLADVAKNVRMSSLEKEIRGYMKSVPTRLTEGSPEKVEVHVDATPHEHVQEMEEEIEHLFKLIEEGKHEEAKEKMRKHMKVMSAEPEHKLEEAHKHELSTLADSVKKLENQLEQFTKLAAALAE
jgi:hypothetical protein